MNAGTEFEAMHSVATRCISVRFPDLSFGLTAAILCIALLSSRALAFPNEPNGFGKAEFGMSAADVKKAFPDLQSKGTQDFLALYQLENQSVLGLKPCSVNLRFADDKLYEIQFTCEQKDQVIPTLKKQFGEPTQEQTHATFWLSKTRSVALNPQSKIFGFVDRQINDVVQQKLFAYLLQHQGQSRVTPGAPATPAPTP
jgi:hypothetical protein